MNVVMLSPGFPDDMPYFTRALAAAGARVYGVGDQPVQALRPEVREALTDYLRVDDLWAEERTVRAVADWMRNRSIDRVECLWEPGMVLVARMREAFGVPGLTVEQTIPFRDKVRMKDVLDRAGLRTPQHARARTREEVWRAADRIGLPLIIKPVDGAGSADTYRCDTAPELDAAIAAMRHVPEVNVEEYVDGEEFTFDTISIGGHVAYENVAWYRPKPLVARLNEWISPGVIALRDLEPEPIRRGRELGRAVLSTLGWDTGIAHMEWFLNAQGDAVFGEIGGRAPGGRLTHVMNYASDVDLFRGWAEAVVHRTFSQQADRRYNAGAVFKRAHGTGRISAHEGLDHLLRRYGEHVAHLDLVPVGQPRRDWRQVVTGDGWVVVRHPDLATTIEIFDAFAAELRVLAS
ncbi:MAG: ATP-grasp domain-containing protein [Planctomycetota bacterium]|nr:ATP-grasp domain-containing protein [Planctomycetota bacterium]